MTAAIATLALVPVGALRLAPALALADEPPAQDPPPDGAGEEGGAFDESGGLDGETVEPLDEDPGAFTPGEDVPADPGQFQAEPAEADDSASEDPDTPPAPPGFVQLCDAHADPLYCWKLLQTGHSRSLTLRPYHDTAVFDQFDWVLGPDFREEPFGYTPDRQTVVAHQYSTDHYEAVVCGAGYGVDGLGSLPGGEPQTTAYAISADGQVVVGHGRHGGLDKAFRWARAGGFTVIWQTNWIYGSYATAVSAKGAHVVGYGTSHLDKKEVDEAYLWTSSGGVTLLGRLPGSPYYNSQACGVAPDGSAVVGTCNSPMGTQAILWTSAGGMIGLGLVSGSHYFSAAYGTTPGGKTVVGMSAVSFDLTTSQAFIWDKTYGMRALKNELMQKYGFPIENWELQTAYAISPDGKAIVGFGTAPDGLESSWMAQLP